MNNKPQTADILQLIHRDPCDTPCDTPCDKPYIYYNKENKNNKENKYNELISSSELPSVKDQSQDQNKRARPQEEVFDSGLTFGNVTPDQIGWQTVEDIEKATIQYYVNPRTRKQKKETRNLKLQIESKSEGYIDYTARLNKDITSLKRFSSNVSLKHQEEIIDNARNIKEQILFDYPGSTVYMGKFKEKGEWTNKPHSGAIEEGTLGIVWFDHSSKNWRFFIIFQYWIEKGMMSKEISKSQQNTNMIAQYIYYPQLKMSKLSRTERRRAAIIKEMEKNNERK